MSIKFLIFLLLCYILYRLAKGALKQKIARFFQPLTPKSQVPEEKLAQCAVCGAFVVEQQIKIKNGKNCCSQDCWDKA